MSLKVMDDEEDSASSSTKHRLDMQQPAQRTALFSRPVLEILHKSEDKVTVLILGGPYCDVEQFLIDTGTIEPAEKFLQSTGASYKLQWERNKDLMEFANRVLQEELMALGMMCQPHIPLLRGGGVDK